MSLEMTRVAGQHARRRVRVLALRALLVLTCVVVVTVIAGLALGWKSLPFMIVELAAIGAMSLLDKLAFPIIDRWDRGATGEEAVGKILDSLAGEGWRPIHDLDTGRGNIDHVVIGPGGVFTVETKSHPGRIRAANVDPAMLRQSYAQCKALERITGIRADPLLVFSRAYLTPAVSRQRGVTVLPARMLAGHLARRGRRLDVTEVERIHGQLSAALDLSQ
jgi:Nuclease-related domain